MIDLDLAAGLGVETKVFKQAVKGNIGRFPNDFMLEMNKKIVRVCAMLLSVLQQGVIMLSCVLNSERAIKVNI